MCNLQQVHLACRKNGSSMKGYPIVAGMLVVLEFEFWGSRLLAPTYNPQQISACQRALPNPREQEWYRDFTRQVFVKCFAVFAQGIRSPSLVPLRKTSTLGDSSAPSAGKWGVLESTGRTLEKKAGTSNSKRQVFCLPNFKRRVNVICEQDIAGSLIVWGHQISWKLPFHSIQLSIL